MHIITVYIHTYRVMHYFICTYSVCIHVYVGTCVVYMCIYVCTCVCVSICMCVCVSVCVCVCACVCVCVSVCCNMRHHCTEAKTQNTSCR